MVDYFRDLVPPSTKLPANDPYRRAQSRLWAGDQLFSATRNFVLEMQPDGNLVLYKIDDRDLPSDITKGHYREVTWSTGTSGANQLEMQDDGNLVLYDSNLGVPWASHTDGRPGTYLRCSDLGDLILYNGGNQVWSSNSGARDRGFYSAQGELVRVPIPVNPPHPPATNGTKALVSLNGGTAGDYLRWQAVFPANGAVAVGVVQSLDVPGSGPTFEFRPPGTACGSGGGIPVSAGGPAVSGANLAKIFGSPTPKLPVAISACVLAANAPQYLTPNNEVLPIMVNLYYK